MIYLFYMFYSINRKTYLRATKELKEARLNSMMISWHLWLIIVDIFG